MESDDSVVDKSVGFLDFREDEIDIGREWARAGELR